MPTSPQTPFDSDKQQVARFLSGAKTVVLGLLIAGMVILTLLSSLFDNPSDPTLTGTSPAVAPQPQNSPFDVLVVPQSLLTYKQIKKLPTGFNRPMDIEWDDNKLYVVGDDFLSIMDADTGQTLENFKLPQNPTSVYVNASFITVTSQNAIFVKQLTDTEFKNITELPAATNSLVDVLANLEMIFAADSFSGTIYTLTANGDVIGKIHPKYGDRKFRVTQTGDFDVIFGAQGMLWVSDPGRGQVMAFNTSGDNAQNLNWGKHGNKLANFSGMYNPIHIAMLPDTNIVTAELNPPRIKVYTDSGTLQAIVDYEKNLSKHIRKLNLTTDATGHIYALDDVANVIRVYEKIAPTAMP